MKKLNSIVWGIVLVIIGVIFSLKALGITTVDVFFDGWWSLFIIVPCLLGLFTQKEKTGNVIGLIVGVVLLLCAQDILSYSKVWKILVPFVIIITGLRLIIKAVFSSKAQHGCKAVELNSKEKGRYNAVFSGQELNFDNMDFCGGDFTAVFGGIDCDLRNAIIESDVVINISAVFGGVDIILPDEINVKLCSNSIFGGVENKKSKKEFENKPCVYINATCIFGGADIK